MATELLLSSLAFSAFHYLGPFGDTFTFNSFTFRFLAGVLLGAIYLSRGLAVSVYTHTNMAKPTPFRKRKSNPVSLIK